ncbi:bifunctional tRNA (5-methylaminomethyl-2-thiouridine)(34)-methyltransferase MnmD/FAD-dependent 5-carboxymethylaminomethyl-2-thiouridine(34) oxidoreductase MnmC [Roseateles aquatilis]|uniref:tRNA 5-methylaminomethyl-2-thiouridine biosynthesis bifunctional protein MnmC n=1 Tax=Roseateles aquatilis TaxID=431061 RepID=A0A246JKD1_9BURK|nr:bifunctional tRNA (5-methylaminomethyl-2-thiouridine)(34)-methyltransferase MnmD/FAD-dependent 5-carboxymethylaminomethyl-2-thiouridine(34) oxidoreductase MnmC [Roseateles aquatilis]OWQ92953.1 bifunctional tRNA (5-methylaminomethyl-2-thiouridine)(34)-methyltransferase MnmD/FAD-dependent 5-carboxymethylaminomethyl-2-thiouridine(34) oxidoreductase MnmC [Roseateles aquatilis]
MKTAPIVPARVDFSGAAAPHSPDFDDVYHAPSGAFTQARHVFLDGNGLPGRWAGRTRFVVLETGFGLGNNFLATWAAWRDDPRRCERLVFLSVEKHPLTRVDLARAHAASPEPGLARQLLDAWPTLTPNLHTLDFEAGRVRLMLAFGDARDWLPELVAQADAFYLDGFAPAKNPELWDETVLRQVGRLAAPDATAATWSVARSVRDGLTAAGFTVKKRPGFGGKWQIATAVFAPRHRVPVAPGRMPIAPDARTALIIGAGLAGAACARALSRAGLQCTVLEAGPSVAAQASGNPGGLFHGTLNADDGIHARFNRAAALATERELRRVAPALPWLQRGLLRVERESDALDAMRALQARCGLPDDYVQALSAEEASVLAGVALARAAWFFPGGGAVSPPALVQAWLDETAAMGTLDLRLNTPVSTLRRDKATSRWSALGPDGEVIASADAVVVCGGMTSAAVIADMTAGPAWPWVSQRGQLSWLSRDQSPPTLSMPVAGLGYALSLPDGGLCFGASADAGDMERALREADQAQNLARLRQLLPSASLPDHAPLAGRVGWRSLAPDRLPIVGAIPAEEPARRAEQARFWPRQPGLMVVSALASRGLTWATLCAELVTAQLTGAPWPVEASLAEAVDPARFGARAVRTQG